MKKVILKRITIDHWRGQKMDITFDGNTNIYGKNKVGKSTIFNAFLWVMTGCDSSDRSNFQLFDNRLPMTYENAIPARVDVTFDIDGDEYKFSRIAKQSWSRKRGESEYTKGASDNYELLIDDISLTSGEFKKRIEDMFCPIDKLKIVLNIKQIYNLDWKEQRQMFAAICDEIKPEDFKGSYSDLFKELEKYSLSELESRIKTIADPLKTQLKSLPLTIQTLELNLPDDVAVADAKSRIIENDIRLSELDKELQGSADAIKKYIDKRNKELENISNKCQYIHERKREYEKEYNIKCQTIEDKLKKIQENNRRHELENIRNKENQEFLQREIKRYEDLVQYHVNKREELIKEKNATKELKFNDYNCSYCGQSLPEDRLNSLLEQFEINKERELKEIVAKGIRNNELRDQAIEKVKSLKKELEDIPENHVLESTEEVERELAEIKENVTYYENTEEYATLLNEIKELEKNLTVVPEQDNSGIFNMKEMLMNSIKKDSELIGLEKERKKQEKKIEELKEQALYCSNQLAIQERLEAQLKEYKQEYANLISDKVNVKLNRCKVTMMEQNKSGAWTPSCSITTDGIQSTVYNDAEKILSGIDISDAFARFYEINMPLFIDNAECISSDNEINTERQVIKLIVDEGELRND